MFPLETCKGSGRNSAPKAINEAALLLKELLQESMLSSLLGQNAQGLLPHKISISLGFCLVFLSDVIPAGSGGVVLAVGSQAAANPNAGAVEPWICLRATPKKIKHISYSSYSL